MATEEERASARRRLEIHRKNLRILEEQAATYAGDVPLHIVNQMDEERVKIASLDPIANPPSFDDTQVFVARVGDGNGGNWAMLFSQFVLVNQRTTELEKLMRQILDEQSRASVWRLAAGEDIEALKDDTRAGEHGRRRNFWLLVASVSASLVALAVVLLLAIR